MYLCLRQTKKDYDIFLRIDKGYPQNHSAEATCRQQQDVWLRDHPAGEGPYQRQDTTDGRRAVPYPPCPGGRGAGNHRAGV